MIKAADIKKINPKEFKWLAMDDTGEVFAYDCKPNSVNYGIWRRERGNAFFLVK